MKEAKALRVLADKLDELEALKAFPAEIAEPGEITVSWTEGKDHDGYESLSAAISALVGQHWNALRSQVMKSKESEVQAARTAWTSLSSGGTPSATPEPAPATTPPATENGVRRFG